MFTVVYAAQTVNEIDKFPSPPAVHIVMGNTSFGRKHVKSSRLFCSLGLGYETRGLTHA